jgi:anaerobic selenocysteine-containing dehydrogenase
MVIERIVKSACELCNQGCGVLIHLNDGHPTNIQGDPSDPVSWGALCIKGANSLDYLTNPLRLRSPLKRTGERGQGKWQKISWEEAFKTTAEKLAEIKNKFGPESVAFMRGGAKGYQDVYLARFANVFGSPNIASMAPLCFVPRSQASALTYGAIFFPDFENSPALILMWAVNTRNTAIGEWKRTTEALRKGSKLIVIDPWKTEFSGEAQVWVKPRPCSDLALALSMINVIINENLYDREFIEKYTIGFDKLKAHIQSYPPEKGTEITWVPADVIRQIARAYAASKPACLVWGNGIDNNINNFQTARALAILRTITGNLNKPGGNVEWSPSGILPKDSPELSLHPVLPPGVRAKRLNALDGILPINFYVQQQSIFNAIITGKPYPVKAAYIQGSNLLHSLADANNTHEALNKLDFLVAADLYMTPTAEIADIVLPVSMFLEINSLHEGEYVQAANIIQKVAQTGECRSDYQILAGLAESMGLGQYFKETDKELMDKVLKPAGLTWSEFEKVGSVSGAKQYRKHEKSGFSTPSHKVEIYSPRLAEWGFDPLPVYVEPPESPFSSPELTYEYPFVLTNHKLLCYQHARERYIEPLRKTRPEPIVHIQTDTAGKLGIKEGDWVYIQTIRGKVKQKANLVQDIDPRVIFGDFGWWFPEKDASTLHGWAESNLNILTRVEKPWGREMGTPSIRGIVCKISKI